MVIRKSYARVVVAATVSLLPSAAHADVLWPALALEPRLLSVPLITAGLVIEALILRFGFAMGWNRACIASIVVNTISTALGALLIPLAGLMWEVFPGLMLYKSFGMGTFNPLTWLGTFLLALAITTSIEVTGLRRFFNVPMTKRTWILWALANAATVGLAFASLTAVPLQLPS